MNTLSSNQFGIFFTIILKDIESATAQGVNMTHYHIVFYEKVYTVDRCMNQVWSLKQKWWSSAGR